MYKIAVIGDYDSIYGFGTLGLDIYPVKDGEEAAQLIRKLVNNKYAVIYITEEIAAQISAEIQKYAEQPLPAIILIPGVFGNTGQGIESVRQSVEKAVGSDILFGNN